MRGIDKYDYYWNTGVNLLASTELPFTDETPTPRELARRDWLAKADAAADYREAHNLIIDTYEKLRAVARVALREYQRLEAEEG